MDQRRHWRASSRSPRDLRRLALKSRFPFTHQHGDSEVSEPASNGTTKFSAGATNHFHAGAFLRSGLDAGYPDLQFHFLPIAMNYDGSQQVNHHGIQAHVGPMKPLSRGRVSIQSSDPFASPQIHFNYLSAEEDWAVMRHGIRLAEALLGEQSFQSMGAWPLKRFGSDAELDEWIRLHAESAYHPCGTCRMGKEGEAPVSPEGEVWGVRIYG